MKIRFEKWEGLGNDFVLIRDPGVMLDDAAVRRICDRRLGVGADGVLIVAGAVHDGGTAGSAASAGSAPKPPVDTGGTRSSPRMIVRNADGSRPEMCGNGLRCVAGHLCQEGVVTIDTDAGPRRCEVRRTSHDRAEVLVDMGVARGGPELVAVVGGREHRFVTIDMGNPHAISFEPHGQGALDVLGPAVAVLPPGGTNVELVRLDEPSVLIVEVWERGVGRTLACGTGACAVAVAACDTGRARFDTPLTVVLPGGSLEITVAAATRAVRMRGPARRVFSGEVVIA
jgi:diaminopimelate epimerase